MPQGIEVFTPAGALRFTSNDRLTRITGLQTLSGTAGSVTVNTAYGTPWAMIQTSGMAIYDPVTIVGNTISWPANTFGLLMYGVY